MFERMPFSYHAPQILAAALLVHTSRRFYVSTSRRNEMANYSLYNEKSTGCIIGLKSAMVSKCWSLGPKLLLTALYTVGEKNSNGQRTPLLIECYLAISTDSRCVDVKRINKKENEKYCQPIPLHGCPRRPYHPPLAGCIAVSALERALPFRSRFPCFRDYNTASV